MPHKHSSKDADSGYTPPASHPSTPRASPAWRGHVWEGLHASIFDPVTAAAAAPEPGTDGASGEVLLDMGTHGRCGLVA